MTEELSVLLIEDSEGDAYLVIWELCKGGLNPIWQRVDTAQSFKKCLEQQSWDIIIADYHLPNFDAPEALRIVRDSHQDIPFIVVSGIMGEQVAVDMMKSGAHDYLMKDNLIRLPETVKREVREAQVRKAQKQTGKHLKLQQAAIEAAIDGIGILNNETFLYVNQSQLSLFGYEHPEELVGKTWQQLYSPQEAENLEKNVLPQLKSQRSWQGEVVATRQDGSTFDQGISLTLTEDDLLISVSRDISHLKQTEAEINHLNTVLEQRVIERTAQLESMKETAEVANHAKSKFLANMSHELRTPLNAILGFSQLMQREKDITPDQQENLRIINRSGEHLLQLINNVLTLSKIEAGCSTINSQDCNLLHLCEGIAEMYRHQIEKKDLQLKVLIAQGTPISIKTDLSKLRQILINIIGNAVKFTQRGSIKLQISGEVSSSCSQAHRINFEIQDTGPGIPEDDLELLFQAFQQSKLGLNDAGGTGLGLTISKSFAQLLDGDMTINSQLGEGTLVSFHILVADSSCFSASPPEIYPVIGLAPHHPTYRLLVVDDHQESRQLMVTLLSSVGFEVKEAENGHIAIELTETWQPDLIWMDLQMPVLDGLQATRKIKARPNPPVIVALSANAFEKDEELALKNGCDGFVRKPILENNIFETIANHLDVQYLYSEPKQLETSTIKSSLTVDELAVMPQAWLQELAQAALSLNEQHLEKLLQTIPPEHETLRTKILSLSQSFSFHQIVELTQESLGSTPNLVTSKPSAFSPPPTLTAS